jgi:RNA polymerase sigma-70 factor, ECF subfamily
MEREASELPTPTNGLHLPVGAHAPSGSAMSAVDGPGELLGNDLPTVAAVQANSPPDGPADGDLVREVLDGRREAFDELIRRYQRQAVAVSYRLLGNSHDALEVTQDAFLKSFTSLSTLQKPEAFGGWLMRIVSNLSLNFRRSRKTRSQLPLDDLLGPGEPRQSDVIGTSDWMVQGDPVHRLESEEMGRRLKTALGQLPDKQRLAIIMFTIEQMPQKQVAEALQCSVEAVKWHVFQGRKKLRELLKDHL